MTTQGKVYNPQLRNWSQFVQEAQAQVPSLMPLAMDIKFPKRITIKSWYSIHPLTEDFLGQVQHTEGLMV